MPAYIVIAQEHSRDPAESQRYLWYQSAAYQEASKHRCLGGDCPANLVEGVES